MSAAVDVPWAATSIAPAMPPALSSVDVVPGYASHMTATTPATLSQPWSGHLLVPAAVPPVASLKPMVLGPPT